MGKVCAVPTSTDARAQRSCWPGGWTAGVPERRVPHRSRDTARRHAARSAGLRCSCLHRTAKAELQQATSGLVVCGITADEIAKLRLGKLEIAGGVTLTQPIQGIGGIDAVGIELQKAQEQLRGIVVLAVLQRIEGHVVGSTFVVADGQGAWVAMDGRRLLGSCRRWGPRSGAGAGVTLPVAGAMTALRHLRLPTGSSVHPGPDIGPWTAA